MTWSTPPAAIPCSPAARRRAALGNQRLPGRAADCSKSQGAEPAFNLGGSISGIRRGGRWRQLHAGAEQFAERVRDRRQADRGAEKAPRRRPPMSSTSATCAVRSATSASRCENIVRVRARVGTRMNEISSLADHDRRPFRAVPADPFRAAGRRLCQGDYRPDAPAGGTGSRAAILLRVSQLSLFNYL
jgi:hypothetical protein